MKMRERVRKRVRTPRYLAGSYTVEASLVMSFALFFIAALLTGIFQIHSRVVGSFVLQEGLERLIYLEDSEAGDSVEGKDASGKNAEGKAAGGTVEEEELRRLRSFFWCGGAELTMQSELGRFSGRVEAAGTENRISVKDFDPETFLRILRAAGV